MNYNNKKLKNEIKPHDFGNEGKDEVYLYTSIMTYLDHLKSPVFFVHFIFSKSYRIGSMHPFGKVRGCRVKMNYFLKCTSRALYQLSRVCRAGIKEELGPLCLQLIKQHPELILGSEGHILTPPLSTQRTPARLKGGVHAAEVCLTELLVSALKRGLNREQSSCF